MAEPRLIDIHGKPYEPVASRVDRFWGDKPGWSITTEVLYAEDRVLVKASVIDDNRHVRATGHGEEQRNATFILKTSAVEVAETSAIGRALACLGYLAGGEFASANEVETAIHQQKQPEPVSVDPDLVKRVVAATVEHVKNEDAGGMREVWDELSHDEQSIVWREFNSRQKKAIRDLLQQGAKESQE